VARVVTETILRTGNVSVDPYMRQLMDGGWPLHEPLDQGRAIGRVVKSETGEFPEGALIVHTGGWSTHAAVFPGQRGARLVQPASGIPLSAYLSVLGGTGMTAYVGIREILRLREGETVFITGAAGAVGSVAGQISRLLGARVIGSVGSAAKVRHVTGRLGFDAAFDYHDGPLGKLLAKAAPDGIDATLTLRGYMVRHYMHLRDEAEAWLIPRLRSGALRADEQIVSGFDNIVSAFLGMLRGENIGKTIVQIASDSSRQGRPLLPSDGPGRVPAEGPR
jgi:NADPH-dependent curcumin reductase CurA